MMKLSDKLLSLRKQSGLSQEELAEKLNVSRQAISRWEVGSAQPDATNILQLSKLFGVTADYLLNDDYESDNDIPKIKKMKEDNTQQILIFLVTLEVMMLILQFMSVFILQNIVFGILSFLPFVAAIGGFEYVYRKKENEKSERTRQFRRRFYKISAWLGWYFPIRLLVNICSELYPRPYSSLVLECIIVAVYIAVALITNLTIEKSNLSNSTE